MNQLSKQTLQNQLRVASIGERKLQAYLYWPRIDTYFSVCFEITNYKGLKSRIGLMKLYLLELVYVIE